MASLTELKLQTLLIIKKKITLNSLPSSLFPLPDYSRLLSRVFLLHPINYPGLSATPISKSRANGRGQKGARINMWGSDEQEVKLYSSQVFFTQDHMLVFHENELILLFNAAQEIQHSLSNYLKQSLYAWLEVARIPNGGTKIAIQSSKLIVNEFIVVIQAI